nr:MAG TPA: tailspike protein [Caudoviricetes sp.]
MALTQAEINEVMQQLQPIIAKALNESTSIAQAQANIQQGVTQYIGARYVPLFADPIEWDNTRAYEPFTIVLYHGNSYTTRQYTPMGIDINNDAFWALTGNYNAQVEQYRQEVLAFDTRITNAQNRANEAYNKAEETAAAVAKINSVKHFDTLADLDKLSSGDVVYVADKQALYAVTPQATINGYDVISVNDYVLTLQHDPNTIDVTQLGSNMPDDYSATINYALQHYKHVILPPGTYTCNETLSVPEHTTLMGYTHETYIKNVTTDCIKLTGRYAKVTGIIAISDNTAPSNNGVVLTPGIDSYHIVLRDLWLEGFSTGVNINNATVWNCLFERVRCSQCTTGFDLRGNASFGNTYNAIYTDACVVGLIADSERGSAFIACNFGAKNLPCLKLSNTLYDFISCNFEVDTAVDSGAFVSLTGYGCVLQGCKINMKKVSGDKAIFDLGTQTNLSNVALFDNYSVETVPALLDNVTYVRRNVISSVGQNVSITFPILTNKNSEVMYSLPNTPIRYWSGEAAASDAKTAIQNNGNGTIAYDKTTNTLQYVKNGVLSNV